MTDLKLASAGDCIKLWDCSGYGSISQFNPHSGNVYSLCWSTDNTFLASASITGDKIVQSVVGGTVVKEFAVGDCRTCLALNSGSRYLAAGSTKGLISVWDLKTNTLRKSYKDHKGAITSIQFNWNDTYVASGSETGQIILHNVVTGMGCSPLVAPRVQSISQVQYSYCKKSLLGSVSNDGAVNLWDTNSHKLLHSFNQSHKAPATGLVFSPLNEMLMISVGLDKKIVCYDVQGKTAVRTMVAESPLTSIDLMWDGVTLAVGSTRGKVHIYDLRQGANPVRLLAGHKSSVQALAFQNKVKQSKNDVGGKATTKSLSGAKKSSSASHKQTPTNDVNTDKVKPGPDERGLTDKTNYIDYNQGPQPGGRNSYEPNEIFSVISDTSASPMTNRHLISLDYSSENRPATQGISDLGPDVTPGSAGHVDGGLFSALHKSSMAKYLHQLKKSSAVFNDRIFSPEPNSSNRKSRGDSSAYGVSVMPALGSGNASHSSMVPERDASNSVSPEEKKLQVTSDDRMSSLSPRSFGSTPGLQQDHDNKSSRGKGSPDGGSSLNFKPSPPMSKAGSQYLSPREAPDRPNSVAGTQGSAFSVTARDLSSAAGAEAAAAEGTSSPATAAGLQSFHSQFIANMIEEALEEMREQIRRDVLGVQMEMLRQFQIQKAEIQALMEKHSINEELLAEVERLREENKQLKRKY